MRGLTWTVIVGFVAGVISLGLPVPDGLHVFHLLGAGGAMAGYAIGECTVKDVRPGLLAIRTVGGLALLVASGIAYTILIDRNYSGPWIVIVLGLLITSAFFGLVYLMASAGVVVHRLSGRKE